MDEFRHADVVAGRITENEYEAISEHIFNSQATGDLMYASSPTQLSRLGIGLAGQPLLVEGGIPVWSDALTIVNDLTKTTILGKTGDYTRFGDAAATSKGLASEDDLMVTGKLEVEGDSFYKGTMDCVRIALRAAYSPVNGSYISGGGAQDRYLLFKAFDTGVAEVEIARLQGAADPYFSMGGSQEFKFYNSGYMNTTGFLEWTEMAAPGAGAANTARIYAVVGGDTLTDLAAVFQDGTVDIFAQEATEPNSPIFEFPDDTNLKLTLRKPDRKTVRFVATFPDGREFVMREIQYPTKRWN